MFHFKQCTPVPEQGGRGYCGPGWRPVGFGGLVKVDGKILWRGERGGMYDFDVDNSKFEKCPVMVEGVVAHWLWLEKN